VAKHIHKTTRDGTDRYNKNISSDDEWSHITGEIKQQDSADPLAPKDRIIAFSNRFQHTTKEQLAREKLEQLKDEIGNTDQYFRFANQMIKNNLDKLRGLKEGDTRFTGELGLFQNKAKTRYDLEKLNSKYITEDEIKELLSVLEEECEKMKDHLLYLELMVQKTKDDITKKRDQISKVKDELKFKIARQN